MAEEGCEELNEEDSKLPILHTLFLYPFQYQKFYSITLLGRRNIKP